LLNQIELDHLMKRNLMKFKAQAFDPTEATFWLSTKGRRTATKKFANYVKLNMFASKCLNLFVV